MKVYLCRYIHICIFLIYDTYILDTIEDYRTQIRRSWQGDLTILSNFHIKTFSLQSASDYELRL